MVLRGFAGGGAHGFQAVRIGEQGDRVLGHGSGVPYLAEDAVYVVLDELRDAADAGRDRGDAAGHGFERGETEGLHFRGHQHEVGHGEELVDVVLLAEEVDAILDAVLAGEVFGGWNGRGHRR